MSGIHLLAHLLTRLLIQHLLMPSLCWAVQAAVREAKGPHRPSLHDWVALEGPFNGHLQVLNLIPFLFTVASLPIIYCIPLPLELTAHPSLFLKTSPAPRLARMFAPHVCPYPRFPNFSTHHTMWCFCVLISLLF